MDIRNILPEEYRSHARWTLIGLGLAAAAIFLGMFTVVIYQVYFGDDDELKKSTILARINEETSIYTVDEETRIGSFFDNAHRSYVEIDHIPTHMVRAMVAAEDKNFYNHLGIDPVAIGTAFAEGVVNGFRFRRGGSSITQQTVKNIMDKREHSFRRKFKEMIRALQLERMYSKSQILEFYLNQFHVTANGKGVGIAAQYYFNKDVRDLSLVEAAFIAGSVKAPSKYNPFVKYTEEGKAKAWVEADHRKNYVIRRMYEQGWITEQELKDAQAQRVPFKQGKFRSNEVALVQLIRGQLNKKEILDAIGLESIAELDNAGLKIYTTLDGKLQEKAQLMLRRNLARLETVLKGFALEDPKEFKPLRDLEVDQFYFGKVIKVLPNGGKPEIHLDFGLPKGVIPYESVERHARILDLPVFKGYQHHVKEISAKVKPGDVLFVEVKEYNPDTHQAVLEMRQRPTVNGGLISIDKGEVRAVVAGFDPKGFNRAMFATRQPGSVFKSVAYFAGLQLGWSITDRLDNERRMFPFQGKFYYPRPDHQSPYKDVSMVWAGVKSENLASVYLTAHLLDKLNFGQFKTLMGTMDLLPYQGEAPRDFHYRVAKETGVQLDNLGIREHLLVRVIDELKPDLIFAGRGDLWDQLSRMWYGKGYVAEMANLYNADGDEFSDTERGLRINLVKNNFERLGILATDVTGDWDAIQDVVNKYGAEGVFTDERAKTAISRFRVLSTSSRPELGYVPTLPDELAALRSTKRSSMTVDPPPGRALNPLDVQAIWGDAGAFGEKANISVQDVKLSGFVPLSLFTKLRQLLEARVETVMANDEKYSLYRYFNHHDFRIILGLKYLVDLTKAMGVYSKVEPVLSFPLGTNDVSVAEVAKIYQTFTEGKIYKYYKDGPQNQLNFIRRIEDRDGNVLFEPKREEAALTDSCLASQMDEILGKVVTHGTGSRARGELHLDMSGETGKKGMRIRIPAYGKTGTTNDYTTAYFAGFVPYPVEPRAPLSVENSYTIASYVGYDRNKTMRRGGYRISGAQGALPVWTDFAKAVIQEKKYAEFVDKLDINLISRQVWPMKPHGCTVSVTMDLANGAVMQPEGSGDSEVFQMTNFEKEGEVFINEFDRDVPVRSQVRLAMSSKGGSRAPRREFKPFTRERTETRAFEETSDPSLDNALDGGTNSGQAMPIIDVARPSTPTPPPAVEAPREPRKEEPKAKDDDLNPMERAVKKLNELLHSASDDKPKAPAGGEGSKEAPKMIPKEQDDPGYAEDDLW